MSYFQRNRTFANQFSDVPELNFKIPDSVISRFDQPQTEESWREICNELSYDTHSLTFQQIPSGSEGGELFEVFIPVPEGYHCKLRFKLDRDMRCFFVIGIQLENQCPTHSQILKREYVVNFCQVRDRVTPTSAFYELVEELRGLKSVLRKRDLDSDKEYTIWKKYIEATRKIAEEKAILLRVTAGVRTEEYNRRDRTNELVMSYKLDEKPIREAVKEEIENLLRGEPLMEFMIDEKGGYLDLRGRREIVPEMWKKLDEWLGMAGFALLPENRRVSMHHLFRLEIPANAKKKKGKKKTRHDSQSIDSNLKVRESVLYSFRNEFGKKVEIESDKGGSLVLNVPIRVFENDERIPSFLEKFKNSHPQVKIAQLNPEGNMRIIFEASPERRKAMLDELWSKVGRQKVKFLTEEEKEAYEKEKSGTASSYRGGTELGRVKGLRDGKVKLVLEEDAKNESNAKLSNGYLLPVLYGDLAQIQRQEKAMKRLHYRNGGGPANPGLKNFIFDPAFARPINLEPDITSDKHWQLRHQLNESNLNEKQREAVWKALQAEDLCLIQGPPGTGKTTVIAEIIWQMLQENSDARILIASQAHLAVDNALERLYRKSLIRPLRVAASSNAKKNIEPEGRKYFREQIVEWSKAAPNSKKEQENARNIVPELMGRIIENISDQQEFSHPLQKWREQLQSPAPDVKGFFADIYLQNVNIVAATCLECGQKDFLDAYSDGFDCVIIDEASKATPPEMLIPMVLGRKIVIIGDHKQLPPMIEEKDLKEALEELGHQKLASEIAEIKVSQFEKLFLNAADSIKVTLDTQYRMHKDIMDVIDAFYQDEGGLKCGIEASMDRKDLYDKASRWHGIEHPDFLDEDTHVVWIDTQSPEINHDPSFSNEGEVEVVEAVVEKLLASEGWSDYIASRTTPEEKEIGMVSFYGKQVEMLRRVENRFQHQIPIRLRTVDKFQGMERDIMIVSTVRSDTQRSSHDTKGKTRQNKSIGFAKDFRRINVAFSRARRLLVVVGNLRHFASDPQYNHIARTIKRGNGRIITEKQFNR